MMADKLERGEHAPFCFLDLYPGKKEVASLKQLERRLKLVVELRNRIYEFVVTPKLVTKMVRYQPDRPVELLTRKTKSQFPRRYLGIELTQVCRQVRAEFRPIWQQSVVVRLGELKDYLCIFHEYVETTRELFPTKSHHWLFPQARL